jgi:predicted chitinase
MSKSSRRRTRERRLNSRRNYHNSMGNKCKESGHLWKYPGSQKAK